jgi:predicted TIM-barrel fold metal-dependent hydrolase
MTRAPVHRPRADRLDAFISEWVGEPTMAEAAQELPSPDDTRYMELFRLLQRVAGNMWDEDHASGSLGHGVTASRTLVRWAAAEQRFGHETLLRATCETCPHGGEWSPASGRRGARMTMAQRYTVISADCHGGGDIPDYRPYLDPGLRAEFDAWRAGFDNPYDDLQDPGAGRNWDHGRRLAELEADGVVGEVIFPNTIPPFFPQPSLLNQPPPATAGDLDLRWAGLHAHNQWLADFCAAAPGRRAGIAQILLHDVDRAVDEVRWARDAGLTGGVLLPGAPPGSGLPPLYAPDYEPLWATCAELGMPLNHHSGSAAPDYGDYPEAKVMFLLEVTWWAHRTLWHLIFCGALDRHPDLQLVFTEQGTAWLPEQLATLDHYYGRMSRAAGDLGAQEQIFGGDVTDSLALKPSEYWARQCHVGASFIRHHEVGLRDAVGVDKIMWGSDFPHREGCWPYSRQHLRLAFAGVDPTEVGAMVGGNAARLYGFDLDALAPVAARVGPLVDEVARPLGTHEIPPDALRCPAFAAAAQQSPVAPT